MYRGKVTFALVCSFIKYVLYFANGIILVDTLHLQFLADRSVAA